MGHAKSIVRNYFISIPMIWTFQKIKLGQQAAKVLSFIQVGIEITRRALSGPHIRTHSPVNPITNYRVQRISCWSIFINPSSGKAPFMSSSLHDRILEKCFESFFTVLITLSTFGHALLSRTLSLSSFFFLATPAVVFYAFCYAFPQPNVENLKMPSHKIASALQFSHTDAKIVLLKVVISKSY